MDLGVDKETDGESRVPLGRKVCDGYISTTSRIEFVMDMSKFSTGSAGNWERESRCNGQNVPGKKDWRCVRIWRALETGECDPFHGVGAIDLKGDTPTTRSLRCLGHAGAGLGSARNKLFV